MFNLDLVGHCRAKDIIVKAYERYQNRGIGLQAKSYQNNRVVPFVQRCDDWSNGCPEKKRGQSI